MTILEAPRQTPVRYEADVCVAGGSCTGVFAAVRAARMGAKVVLLERTNIFGGMATSGLVNIWHSLHDIYHDRQVIAGLTAEMLERLAARDAVVFSEDDSTAYTFNPTELAFELDELVREHSITPVLHTQYAGVLTGGDRVEAAFIQNKDGRGAVRAKFFIDCTGDGDICRDLGLDAYRHEVVQPPTACFLVQGELRDVDICALVHEHGEEFGLGKDWGWSDMIPFTDISMRADRHVLGALCDRADDLTFAEMDGRRQMDAVLRMVRKYGPSGRRWTPIAACSQIGIRDTVHFRTRVQAEGMKLLVGKPEETAVLRGTYRADIHQKDGTISFRYLDGREETIDTHGIHRVTGDWREKDGITSPVAAWYEAPFEMLVTDRYANFLPAGRMIHADDRGFGALRVMVNLNQLGEAAGTAAALCLNSGEDVRKLDGRRVRAALREGGSAL